MANVIRSVRCKAVHGPVSQSSQVCDTQDPRHLMDSLQIIPDRLNKKLHLYDSCAWASGAELEFEARLGRR